MRSYQLLFIISIALLTFGCIGDDSKKTSDKIDQHSYDLGVVSGFSELINAGVKQLALSAPMTNADMDDFIEDAKEVAAKYNVSTYREADLIVTELFPADVALDQEVLLLYQGNTLDSYLALKKDQQELKKKGALDLNAQISVARRFGRLLSYSPRKINKLLTQNTSFRTMSDFGIRASNLFLYYRDLKAASTFYADILGLELVASYDIAEIFRMAAESYLILVDEAKGMHSADEPKTVALALLTEQLDEWYTYLKSHGVKIKYDYKPKEGGPHDGFVIVDPEGYLLEIEKFKQHPENELFIPILRKNEIPKSSPTIQNKVPDGLGFHSTITWLYYKDLLGMQHFYENVLGLEMVADQGWTKIYKSTNSGFVGLVDERRGMHKFTEQKAVNVSFIIDDLEGWHRYVTKNDPFELRSDKIGSGPEDKYKAFVGYDPEGYYMEFDAFFPHKDNTKLLKCLGE